MEGRGSRRLAILWLEKGLDHKCLRMMMLAALSPLLEGALREPWGKMENLNKDT